ncbi:MAG: TerL, partial [Proteobacteria bacterium]|nr:TerL [Pseudomonadota bacterium]
MSEFRIDYEPDGVTLERFLVSEAPVAGIIGPWGSGKSRASCVKLGINAAMQAPSRKAGVRRRRTLIT